MKACLFVVSILFLSVALDYAWQGGLKVGQGHAEFGPFVGSIINGGISLFLSYVAGRTPPL